MQIKTSQIAHDQAYQAYTVTGLDMVIAVWAARKKWELTINSLPNRRRQYSALTIIGANLTNRFHNKDWINSNC